MPSMPTGFEFHHIGYATTSIEKEKDLFTHLGYQQEGMAFADPIQGIAGCFLVGLGPRIELLENLPGSSTLNSWLDAGVKIYHFAYMVADIDGALTWVRSLGAKIT